MDLSPTLGAPCVGSALQGCRDLWASTGGVDGISAIRRLLYGSYGASVKSESLYDVLNCSFPK